MDAQRQHSAPVSRQTFLKGMAGVAVVAGTRNLWTGGSPSRAANSARPAQQHGSQQASVMVDLSQTTGATIQPYLYGYASGTLLDNNFQLAASKAAQTSAKTLTPTLIRFNTSASTLIQPVFAQGFSQLNRVPFSHWVQHHADFLRDHPGRLVFGIGPAGGDTSIPPAAWAQYAAATALHFREIGQKITHWEVGNECDLMGLPCIPRTSTRSPMPCTR